MLSAQVLPTTARCRNCGYLLRGLQTNVCPECGAAFDPSNPDSYNDPQRRLEWLRRERRQALRMLIAPPGVVTYFVLGWFWAWQFRPTFSLPAWYELRYHDKTRIMFFMALLLIVWIPAGWLVQRRLDPAVYPRWRYQGLRRWGILALLLLTLGGLAQPWGVWARFERSRAALEAEIATAMRTRNPPRFCRMGEFEVEYIHLNWRSGGVFVQTEHDKNDTRYGFVYYPPTVCGDSTSAKGRWALEMGLPARWHR